ncbi:unnamed protein product [Alopecurus aequalis]
MAAKAPLVCFLLLLVASAVLTADAAATCDESSKLEKCKDSLLRKVESVTDGCCEVLGEQYGCLCEYARMPNSDYLHQLTEEVGGVILASCGLDGLSCTNSATAAA